MMTGPGWLIGISAAIVALAFIGFVIVGICFFISIKKTLENTNRLLQDTDAVVDQVEKKDPFLRSSF